MENFRPDFIAGSHSYHLPFALCKDSLRLSIIEDESPIKKTKPTVERIARQPVLFYYIVLVS
jgi:hypothetical protein